MSDIQWIIEQLTERQKKLFDLYKLVLSNTVTLSGRRADILSIEDKPAFFPMAYAAGFLRWDHLAETHSVLRLHGATLTPSLPTGVFTPSFVSKTDDFGLVEKSFDHVIGLYNTIVEDVTGPDGVKYPLISNAGLMPAFEIIQHAKEQFYEQVKLSRNIFTNHLARSSYNNRFKTYDKIAPMLPYLEGLLTDTSLLRLEIELLTQ